MKTFDEFMEDKVISYAMAQPATVFPTSGKKLRLKKKQALAKRSSSSAGD